MVVRSGKVVLDGRNLEVVTALDDGATDVDTQVAAALRDGLVANSAVHILDFLSQARCVLVTGQVLVVKSDIAAGDHGDLEALAVLQPVEKLLERDTALFNDNLVVVGVSFGDAGDRAAHDRVELLRLVPNDVVGLGEHDLRKGQVAEGVLELCDIGEALDVLVDLVADHASDHGSGGRDGGNDLTSNHLGLVAVALSDLVVAGTEVSAGIDEIDVVVGVVILLEVSRGQLAGEGLLGNAKVVKELSDDGLVVVVTGGGSRCGSASSLALLGLLRGLDGDDLADVINDG
mmetsp:Transcript_20980/g.25786  ORF Transcript_20980/g.25786 Transcript_20980/m.25786 type:complete len:289 (-) Transcript_20980:2427-3293(-)